MRKAEIAVALFLELTTEGMQRHHVEGYQEVYSSMPMSLTRPKAAPAAIPPTMTMLMAPQR